MLMCISFLDNILLHHDNYLEWEKKDCSLITSNVARIYYLHVSHCKLRCASRASLCWLLSWLALAQGGQEYEKVQGI